MRSEMVATAGPSQASDLSKYRTFAQLQSGLISGLSAMTQQILILRVPGVVRLQRTIIATEVPSLY
jgi:hypothetical protein